MKQIYLYAYDKINLGDDLFVRTIVNRYPKVRFIFWTSKENKESFKDLPNLKVLDQDSKMIRFLGRIRPSIPGYLNAALEKKSDAFVYIGGSIFIEYSYWEYFVEWWNNKVKNCKCFVIGANFGPYHTEEYPRRIRTVFAKMKDICFRDRYSYELFEDCKNVRYAPDILFSYPMPAVTIPNNHVFISVIDCLGKDDSHHLSEYDEKYTKMMAEIITGYINDGCNIVLSSFCKNEGDENAIARIINQIKIDYRSMIILKNYNGTNSDDIIASIASSKLVIGTRFHAIVLALAAGRPVLPIIYSDKTKNVLDDIGFSGTAYDIRSTNTLEYKTCKEHFENYEIMNIDILKKEAVNHFKELDKLFS